MTLYRSQTIFGVVAALLLQTIVFDLRSVHGHYRSLSIQRVTEISTLILTGNKTHQEQLF
jgi:hypothetical protein